ncbi:MAG: UbiA family prenyltransferase [Alphaproteobacteria bacterium]|nr:UbiA family prenyltransferase [Alphaproteobacteria bacterium]
MGSPAGSLGSAWSVALRLGRVSNLPTVWTNVLAGTVLAGGAAWSPRTAVVMLAISLFYIGGMFLNDAFDREFDARERPDRPIPAGEISAAAVFAAGFGLLASGFVLLLVAGYGMGGSTGAGAAVGGVALAGAIVLYDAWHKGNKLSPLLMGLCRMLVYVIAAAAVGAALPPAVWIAALVSLAYLIGLTYVAKQETLTRVENLWPLLFLAAPLVYAPALAASGIIAILIGFALVVWVLYAVSILLRPGPGRVPRAVVSLIAGISLVDAVFIASLGHGELALLAVAAFGLTLAFQRFVAGT